MKYMYRLEHFNDLYQLCTERAWIYLNDKRHKVITEERKTGEKNGRQCSSLRSVYHGRYWGCQSTWKLICQRNSRQIRAARVPPFSPSTLHRSSSLRESSKARKRAFISENRRRRVALRAQVLLDSNPLSLWHEARCFRVLRNSFARACSTRLFALPKSCFDSRDDNRVCHPPQNE